MASSRYQSGLKGTKANEGMKSCATTTSILRDHVKRDGMSSSKQAESDDVTKTCANATTKLRDMTLQDDKLPESTRVFDFPSSKASGWQKAFKETEANEGMKSCDTTTSILRDYVKRVGISSSKQAESDEVTKSCANATTKLRQDDKLPESTSSFDFPSSKASKSRAQANDTKYAVAGERTSGVHCDVTTSQKKPTSSAMNYRLPKDKLETEITAVGKSKLAQYKQMQSHQDCLKLCCIGCDSMGVRYSDLRTIRQIHHTVLDPEFKDRINTEMHKYPNKFDGIEKKEKIYCKHCGSDWGISGIYRRIQIYVLKVSGFTIVDQDHNRHTYLKWREVPFPVNELQQEDMQSLRQTGYSPSSPRVHYDFYDDSHFW